MAAITLGLDSRYPESACCLNQALYRLAEKKIKTNPARLVRQRKENSARIRFLSPREEVMLRGVIAKNYADHMPEFEIALYTGMRCSEQYGTTWENVDLENRMITVPRAKNGEMRHVKLNTQALAIMKSLYARSVGSGPVFHTRAPRHWFEPAVEIAGLKDFTWHCLRHICQPIDDGRGESTYRAGIDGT